MQVSLTLSYVQQQQQQQQPQRIRITTLLAASSGERSNVSRVRCTYIAPSTIVLCSSTPYTHTVTSTQQNWMRHPESDIVISTSKGSCWYIDDPPAGRRRLACAAYRCAIRNDSASSPYDSVQYKRDTPREDFVCIYKSA
uniref:Uncharacterized protein n=1 Tax=Trichogramma kaykai TaxID=54128 RepID=A0ABD2WD20_9HYME